jgi:hypothetical protein
MWRVPGDQLTQKFGHLKPNSKYANISVRALPTAGMPGKPSEAVPVVHTLGARVRRIARYA